MAEALLVGTRREGTLASLHQRHLGVRRTHQPRDRGHQEILNCLGWEIVSFSSRATTPGESDSVDFLCLHDTEHRTHEGIFLQHLVDGLADLGFLVCVPPPFRLRRGADSVIQGKRRRLPLARSRLTVVLCLWLRCERDFLQVVEQHSQSDVVYTGRVKRLTCRSANSPSRDAELIGMTTNGRRLPALPSAKKQPNAVKHVNGAA